MARYLGHTDMSSSSSALETLRATLAALPSGRIPAADERQVEDVLADVWSQLKGGRAEGMHAGKLHGRTEDLTWQAPVLTFRIERHGGTAQGSTRAELHRWSVNVETGQAECVRAKAYRQLAPRAPVVRVDALAEVVVRAITQQQEHPALTWVTSGRARVVPSRIEELQVGFKQTVTGRRKRFVIALEARLRTVGWTRAPGTRSNLYEREAPVAAAACVPKTVDGAQTVDGGDLTGSVAELS